jgi:hypothetical protein
MELGGWLMLGVSWLALSGVTAFCLVRVLRG